MGVLNTASCEFVALGAKPFNQRSEIETGTEIKQDRIGTADSFGLAGLL
jgi:hypothetical protein